MRHVIRDLPGGKASKAAAIGMAAFAAAATFSSPAWSDAPAQTQPAPTSPAVGKPTAKVAGVPGVHYLKPRHAPGTCVTVYGAQGKGAKVNQYTCLGKKNQKWRFVSVSATPPTYTLRAQHRANLCLSVPGGKYRKGTQLIVWSCSNRHDQRFWINCNNGQKDCTIRPFWHSGRGLCFSIKGGSNAENAPLILWKCSKAKDQRFHIK